jgi:hypothetical protein
MMGLAEGTFCCQVVRDNQQEDGGVRYMLDKTPRS